MAYSSDACDSGLSTCLSSQVKFKNDYTLDRVRAFEVASACLGNHPKNKGFWCSVVVSYLFSFTFLFWWLSLNNLQVMFGLGNGCRIGVRGRFSGSNCIFWWLTVSIQVQLI